MIKSVLFICTLLVSFNFIAIHAQETVIASSGNHSNNRFSHYRIEPYDTTQNSKSGFASRGSQRPFDISIMTSAKAASSIRLQCIVYPMPETDFVILKTENAKLDDLMYLLYDERGRVHLSSRIESDETHVNLAKLAPDTYYLIVSDEEMSKTFKIVKN